MGKTYVTLFCSLLFSTQIWAQFENPDFSAYAQTHEFTVTATQITNFSANEANANFDESKVPNFTLPSLFKLGNTGANVTTVQVWEGQRRQQMIDSIARACWGFAPPKPSNLSFKLVQENKNAMSGKATLKRVAISFTIGTGDTFKFYCNFFVPNNRTGKAPIFLLLNHRGASSADYTRASKGEFWPAEYLIQRGYAIGAVNVSAEVEPDDPVATRGIRLYYKNNHPSPNQFTWGAISAWAWAGHRCVDYLVTDPDIDPDKIAVIGHSRGGKTAYWCGAQDTRIALTCPNGSGKSGPGLIRRMYSRGIKKSVQLFPHWFCPSYITYDGREDELPYDGHFLSALVAPRALHIGDGAGDLLIDPRGSWLAVDSGAEAWTQIYGRNLKALPSKHPLVNSLYVNGPIGYHMREGGHGLLLWDWKMYLDYADSLYSGNSTSARQPSAYKSILTVRQEQAPVSVYSVNGRCIGTYANRDILQRMLAGQHSSQASQPLILHYQKNGGVEKELINVMPGR